MKILVTGSRGTIGKALTEELRRRGNLVYGADLAHTEDERGISVTDGASFYSRCDIGEYRQVDRLIMSIGPDIVYNCAAEFGRWNGEDYYEQLWRTNVVGLKNILNIQSPLGFKLVHFSSSEVYGDWPEIMVESVMDRHEVRQLNDYAMTKWVNEGQIRNSQSPDKTVVVRVFNTYGPGEYYTPYRSVNARFVYCALNDMPWKVYSGHTRTSLFLEDAVRTFANIADNFHGGETYNIGGDEPHTIEELSDIVIQETGCSESLAVKMPSEPMTTRSKRVDCSKARADLNHHTTVSLRNGVLKTAEWMRQVYNVDNVYESRIAH